MSKCPVGEGDHEWTLHSEKSKPKSVGLGKKMFILFFLSKFIFNTPYLFIQEAMENDDDVRDGSGPKLLYLQLKQA